MQQVLSITKIYLRRMSEKKKKKERHQFVCSSRKKKQNNGILNAQTRQDFRLTINR